MPGGFWGAGYWGNRPWGAGYWNEVGGAVVATTIFRPIMRPRRR